MASLYTIKGICILDNDGERVLCKYFDDSYATVKEQKAFESSLFQKTQRANAEIVMFEGITCVYKSNVDLFFYVFGSSNENELILASVLTALYESVSILLRDNVEKMNLFDKYAQVLLIVDELVDGGIIMETDATVLSKAAEGGGQSGGTSEKTGQPNIDKGLAAAAKFFKNSFLS